MRKLIVFIALVIMPLLAIAKANGNQIDSTSIETGELQKVLLQGMGQNGRWKLYKTTNVYTFLLLDTATGVIKQIQWSLDDNKEGTVGFINSEDLSNNNTVPGRFELYPTENIYTFILIDSWYGLKFHVQWGLEQGKRWMRSIF